MTPDQSILFSHVAQLGLSQELLLPSQWLNYYLNVQTDGSRRKQAAIAFRELWKGGFTSSMDEQRRAIATTRSIILEIDEAYAKYAAMGDRIAQLEIEIARLHRERSFDRRNGF